MIINNYEALCLYGNEISTNTLRKPNQQFLWLLLGFREIFLELSGVVLTRLAIQRGKQKTQAAKRYTWSEQITSKKRKVDYEPNDIELKDLLLVLGGVPDPTQGMRQGNDIGSQYRSVVFIEDGDRNLVELSIMSLFQEELYNNNYGTITTEISMTEKYFLAEEYHQQYLAKIQMVIMADERAVN